MTKNRLAFCLFIGLLIFTSFNSVSAQENISFTDYAIDTNENGLYDYLVIEINLTVPEAGEYNLYVELEDNLGGEIDMIGNDEFYLDSGKNIIQLNFSGVNIYGNRVDGPYTLEELEIDGPNFEIDLDNAVYTTSFYSYENFEIPGLEIVGEFTDYGMDIDGNGLYDYLIIEVPIQVNTAGSYEIEVELDLGGYNQEIDMEIYLNESDEFIYFYFDGTEIYEEGENGPYEFEDFTIEQNNLKIYQMGEAYITYAYNYGDFEHGNTTPPEISIIIPKNSSTVKGDFTSLTVETSKDAVCEYSLGHSIHVSPPPCEEGEPCQSGWGGGGASRPIEMEITGDNLHIQPIENLRETINNEIQEEKYNIKVTCTDKSGNSVEAETFFDVDLSELREMMILEDIEDYGYLMSTMLEAPESEDEVITVIYLTFYNKSDDDYFYGLVTFEFNNRSLLEESLEGYGNGSYTEDINGQEVYIFDEDYIQVIIWPHKNLLFHFMVLPDVEMIIDIDDLDPLNISSIPFDLLEAYLEKYPNDLGVEDEEQTISDTISPTITLLSPSDDYTIKTSKSSKTINFRYKVEDESDVQSCNLIVDNVIKETKTNVQKDIENFFSKKLRRSSYDWQIKCIDSEGNIGNSEVRDLKIKKKSSSSSSSSKSSSLYFQQLNENINDEESMGEKLTESEILKLGNLESNLGNSEIIGVSEESDKSSRFIMIFFTFFTLVVLIILLSFILKNYNSR